MKQKFFQIKQSGTFYDYPKKVKFASRALVHPDQYFSNEGVLGRGAFGTVTRMKSKDGGGYVAVKTMLEAGNTFGQSRECYVAIITFDLRRTKYSRLSSVTRALKGGLISIRRALGEKTAQQVLPFCWEFSCRKVIALRTVAFDAASSLSYHLAIYTSL